MAATSSFFANASHFQVSGGEFSHVAGDHNRTVRNTTNSTEGSYNTSKTSNLNSGNKTTKATHDNRNYRRAEYHHNQDNRMVGLHASPQPASGYGTPTTWEQSPRAQQPAYYEPHQPHAPPQRSQKHALPAPTAKPNYQRQLPHGSESPMSFDDASYHNESQQSAESSDSFDRALNAQIMASLKPKQRNNGHDAQYLDGRKSAPPFAEGQQIPITEPQQWGPSPPPRAQYHNQPQYTPPRRHQKPEMEMNNLDQGRHRLAEARNGAENENYLSPSRRSKHSRTSSRIPSQEPTPNVTPATPPTPPPQPVQPQASPQPSATGVSDFESSSDVHEVAAVPTKIEKATVSAPAVSQQIELTRVDTGTKISSADPQEKGLGKRIWRRIFGSAK